LGRRIILPSSFQGSVRHMQRQYYDAMAIVAVEGPPDLFLTFTSNPQWPEIVNNMPTYHSSLYRPDIESRVFKLKLNQLMKDIKDNHILGVPVAHMHVIEFQKRGHPHAHMLLTLRHADKLVNSNLVDALICAALPCRVTTPALYNIVTKFMLHGPCLPNMACMQNRFGRCSKNYPKKFKEETICVPNRFPIYRRPQNGRNIMKNNSIFDNRHVVPYNPYLLLKYNAHINLEACHSIRCIKYLFKYIYKGHDRANIVQIIVEIQNHVDCRYVSPQEAIWRLSKYPLQQKSHTVIVLPVHLQNEQQIFFEDGFEQEALEHAQFNNTMLTGWFALNQIDNDAVNMLYREVAVAYKWENNIWTRREVKLLFNKFENLFFFLNT
jgi:hypothetical protein